jgi:hypothetical protein
MGNPAEQWLTLDGNVVGREELWVHYAPSIRERLKLHVPYVISYSLLVPADSTAIQERRFIERCLPIHPESKGEGVFTRLNYALSTQQMECLVHRAWIEAGDNDTLYHFLTSILQTLNIALI